MPEETRESLQGAMAEALKIADPGAQQRAVDALGPRYEKLVGGKVPVNISESGISVGGGKPTDEEADQSYQAQAIAESDSVLRAELGDQFDSTMREAREFALEITMEAFGQDAIRGEQTLDSLMAGVLAAGGSALEINRLLLAVMKRGAG